jgi:hypothetical protein
MASMHGLFEQWWPVLFIVIALGDLLVGNYLNGACWLLFGILVGLFTTGTVRYNGNIWSIIWPVAIALIGLRVIFRPLIGKGRGRWAGWGELCDWNRHGGHHRGWGPSAVFGDFTQKTDSQDYRGSAISTVFGDAKLDLRDATIAKEGAVIDISTVFGDVTLLVPKKTPVKTNVTAIFGEQADRRETRDIDETLPAITLRGEAIFGAIKIGD